MNKSSRRDFLFSGAATAASGFAIVSPQAVRGAQANSQISIGLIGCGNRGSYDASIAHADPRARITAICDRYPDQFEPAKKTIKVENPATYTEFEKLLAAPDIDAVFIVSPPFEHPRMLEAAIQSKKHIYCEKPIGVDAAGCQRAIKAAKKAEKSQNISVGFQQRLGPEYLEAYKRIQNGDIGELVGARSAWISSDPFTLKLYPDPATQKIRNWYFYKDLSGDIIVEQDCHNLDVLHWFLGGLPVRATGRGNSKVRKGADTLDNIHVIYEWPNDFLVTFEANQFTPRGFSRIGEEFTGTKGTIAVSRSTITHYRMAGVPENAPVKRDITIDAIEAFIGRVVNGDPENVVERSALSTCVALLGRAAAYSGRDVTWKNEIGIAV